jgi:hypothetical protein
VRVSRGAEIACDLSHHELVRQYTHMRAQSGVSGHSDRRARAGDVQLELLRRAER